MATMHATKLRQRILITLSVLALTQYIISKEGFSADAVSVRVSYGGTAGYQLPLWVNKEMGLYKKYGIDLEILLIAAGSPNIQALLGRSEERRVGKECRL